MANPVFIDDSDLYNRIGGQAALTQLLDPQGTGTWNTEVSLLARRDACNLVLAAAGVQADLGGLSASEFAAKLPELGTIASLKAIALCWIYASGGQALPERLASYDQQAEAEMERLATRRRKHGAVDFSPQPAQEVRGSIELGPDRWTLAGWKSSFP